MGKTTDHGLGTRDHGPGLIRKSLFISLFLHLSLLIGVGLLLKGDTEKPAGSGESEIISVSLVGETTQKVPGTFLQNNERERDVSTQQDTSQQSSPIQKDTRYLWGGEGGASTILQQIRNQIERQKYYPLLAKRSKIEGSPLIEFKIKADGSLEYVTLKQSSGAKILDEAATITVQQAAPYPFYPDPIALNIHYELGR